MAAAGAVLAAPPTWTRAPRPGRRRLRARGAGRRRKPRDRRPARRPSRSRRRLPDVLARSHRGHALRLVKAVRRTGAASGLAGRRGRRRALPAVSEHATDGLAGGAAAGAAVWRRVLGLGVVDDALRGGGRGPGRPPALAARRGPA